RYGSDAAPAVVRAWKAYSAAFREFPFHIGLVYTAPMQVGPANLLWGEPTGYGATMSGFPYDDLDAWRAVYPPDVYVAQFRKVADGFDQALHTLKASLPGKPNEDLLAEMRFTEAAAIHFHSTANQARFLILRRALAAAKTGPQAQPLLAELEQVL